MRIDFIVHSLEGGGAERVLVLLASHFQTKGHDIAIITFNEGEDYEIPKSIERIRLHKGIFKIHKLRCLNNLFKHYKIKNRRPDVVISFLPDESLISIIVSKYYNIKIICSEHINHLQKGDYITKISRNFLYRFADSVTVLTHFDKPYYENRGAKVVVMPNPCTFEPLIKNDIDREKTILAVGNLNRSYHKGFDNLIKLIKPILNNNPDWTLKILGSGNKGLQLLKNMVKQADLEDRIIFTGFQNNVGEHMRKSAIFILPSRFEGLPMVLLESMSQGMACISYDCKTGPSEIIINGQNGLLIEDQNQEAMIKGLTYLIKNPKEREKIGINAIERVDDFSIDKVGALWENLLNTIHSL
jgi:GalNAc-alpha-(1->4)-GalNAc-alpha-(1->3)-diNAcBac-PP-undecaprenol alpha-1,4-N-acetyl-D-galactosaminyltransferase